MNWFQQLLCNHWFLHWLHTPDSAMEIKTCSKCGKSKASKIVKII